MADVNSTPELHILVDSEYIHVFVDAIHARSGYFGGTTYEYNRKPSNGGDENTRADSDCWNRILLEVFPPVSFSLS